MLVRGATRTGDSQPASHEDLGRHYEERTYGPSHMRDYLSVRSTVLVELLTQLGPNARILEVACGPGLSLSYLSNVSDSRRLVAIDESADMLKRAVTNTAGASRRPLFARASARCLPFPDGAFDMLYATRFIHQFRDKTAVVDELRRVVHPGGFVVIEFYNRPYHVMRWLKERPRIPLDDFLYHYPGQSEVRGLVGDDAKIVPIRFGGERWLRAIVRPTGMRRMLLWAWHTPLRVAVDEYFAVVRGRGPAATAALPY